MKSLKRGFTLIEVLLVVAILSILAGIVVIAVNPGKQLGDSRNTQRRADVNTIVNAVYQYAVDTGNVPATITNAATDICVTGGTCTGLIDLSVLTTNGKYLVSMPKDPTTATANDTKYSIVKDATSNRVTVTAVSAESGATISVSR